jgi:hypothetical protein
MNSIESIFVWAATPTHDVSRIKLFVMPLAIAHIILYFSVLVAAFTVLLMIYFIFERKPLQKWEIVSFVIMIAAFAYLFAGYAALRSLLPPFIS